MFFSFTLSKISNKSQFCFSHCYVITNNKKDVTVAHNCNLNTGEIKANLYYAVTLRIAWDT